MFSSSRFVIIVTATCIYTQFALWRRIQLLEVLLLLLAHQHIRTLMGVNVMVCGIDGVRLGSRIERLTSYRAHVYAIHHQRTR